MNISSFLRIFFKYGSPFLYPIELLLQLIHGKADNKNPIVFIIGPPRSGSTILYQVISKFYNVGYVNNFIELSRFTPVLGFWLNKKLLKNKTHNSFSSDYGKTDKDGLTAPNEGRFWYEFFPKDVHYCNENSISIRKQKQFRKAINAALQIEQRPLVFKNLSNSMRIKLLAHIFPHAKFLYIKRNPFDNAKSIYQGYVRNNIESDKMWSILPKDFNHIKTLPIHEKVTEQLFSIHHQIKDDLLPIDIKNKLEIRYEDLLDDTNATIEEVSNFIGLNPISEVTFLKKERNKSEKLSDKLLLLQKEIEKKNWL